MTKKEFIEKLEAELKDETYSTVTQVMKMDIVKRMLSQN